jgi:hypothetical protein
MTIKIVTTGLILLMSLAGCSPDKVSRQPTAKLSGGYEDNAPSCPKLCSGGPEGNLLLSRNNTPSEPLQVCSPAADLHTTDDEEEDETARRAREAEARRQHDLLLVEHITQIYGPASTSTIEEQFYDLENYGYTKFYLTHISVQLILAKKLNTPLYKRLSQKISEMPKDMFD